MKINIGEVNIGETYSSIAYGNITTLAYCRNNNKKRYDILVYSDRKDCFHTIEYKEFVNDIIDLHNNRAKQHKIYMIIKNGTIFPIGTILTESIIIYFVGRRSIENIVKHCVEITNDNINYVNFVRRYMFDKYTIHRKYSLQYEEIDHLVTPVTGIYCGLSYGIMIVNPSIFDCHNHSILSITTSMYADLQKVSFREYVLHGETSYAQMLKKYLYPSI